VLPMLRLISVVLLGRTLQSAATNPWMNMPSMVGAWNGTVNGQPGSGTASRTYEFVLGNKFLSVRNKSSYPPQDKNPKGEVHEDLGICQLRFWPEEVDIA
jgi:hypothetical protein